MNIKRLIVCLAAVIVFGALIVEVNYLAKVFDKRMDVTALKQHTLSRGTQDILGELKANIQITVFYVGIPPKYVEDLLSEYKRLGKGQVTTEIVNPIEQIGYAAQFGGVITGETKKAFVRSGNETREIDFTDQPLEEGDLTNAITRVTREARNIYFLSGHQELNVFDDAENGLQTLAKMLLGNNMIAHQLVLQMSKAIPEDCDVLVIAGPQQNLTEDEASIILQYLNQGGDALILVENTVVTTPDQPLTEEQMNLNPSLNEILNPWGISVANDIVVDLTSHAAGDVGSPATRHYMPHTALIKNLDYTFFVRPRSLTMLPDRRQTIKVAPFILTSSDEHSWGETNRELKVKKDEGRDRLGPVPISMVAWEPRDAGDKQSDTRIIVVTDANFLSNAFIGQYSNAQLALNVINWLAELDYEVFVDEREVKVERLDLTSQQRRIVAGILSIIPFLILVSGLVFWMRR